MGGLYKFENKRVVCTILLTLRGSIYFILLTLFFFCIFFFGKLLHLFSVLMFSELSHFCLIWQVPPFLVRKVFTQIFSFINVQLFNRLVCSSLIISHFRGCFLFCKLVLIFIVSHALFATVFFLDGSAAHLVMENMSKLVWLN